MTLTIRKWGNSLGVRIPKAVAVDAGLEEGTRVEVAVKGGAVVLKASDVPPLSDLLLKIKRGHRPPLAEWGGAVGNEVW